MFAVQRALCLTRPLKGGFLRWRAQPILTAIPRMSKSTRARRPARDQSSSSEEPSKRQRPQVPEAKWGLRKRILAWLSAAAGVYYVTHLERMEETGRWRFMNVSRSLENKMAEAERTELLNEFEGKLLPPRDPLAQHIRRVLSRILEANDLGTLRPPHAVTQPREHVDHGLAGREWDLIIVEDRGVPNAYVLFGTIVVFTGILPVAKDEQGLAAVLGHEIGHGVLRHNSERLSRMMFHHACLALLAILGLDFYFSGYLSDDLLRLSNSREQELEADAIGLKFASRACFDPRAAPAVWSRFAQMEETSGVSEMPVFLSTHPASKYRKERLEALLPEAHAIQAASPGCTGMLALLTRFYGSSRTLS